MCGIFGVVFDGPTRRRVRTLAPFERMIRHRGPDDVGYLYLAEERMAWARDPEPPPWCAAAFVHRRLAIIDLDRRAAQPMLSPDGAVALLYNGEIYNFRELRHELEAAGYGFRTRSDTEVLLVGYQAWGLEVVERLNGMFAAVILDLARQRMVLIRDRFGIKPLYLLNDGGAVAVASELPPLIALLDGRAALDHATAAAQIAAHGRPTRDLGPATLVRGISEPPAGSLITFDLSMLLRRRDHADLAAQPAPGVTRRHSPLPLHRDDAMSLDTAMERLRAGFLDAVGRHLISDQPVTTTLSGGIDSSTLVRCIRRLQGPDVPITAFGYVCRDDDRLDETAYMRLAAADGTARLHEVAIAPDGVERALDRFLAAQCEPVTGLSAFAQYAVLSAVAEHGFKVVLDGQGADELLCGYSSYVLVRVSDLARRGQWTEVEAIFLGDDCGHAGSLPGLADRIAIEIALARRTGGGDLPAVLGRCRALAPLVDRVRPWPLAGGWPAGGPWKPHMGAGQILTADALGRATAAADPASAPSPAADRTHRFVHDRYRPQFRRMLRFQDRNAMAVSIENRVPFLDRAFTDIVSSVPIRHLIDRSGLTKAAFRKAFGDLVPDPILARRRKIGFEVPQGLWMDALHRRVAALAEPGGLGAAAIIRPGALADAVTRTSDGAADAPDPDFLCFLFTLDGLVRRCGLGTG